MQSRLTVKLAMAAALVGCFAMETQAEIKHRYTFNTDVQDSVGTAHGTLFNTTTLSTFENGQLILGNDGSQGSAAGNGDYVELPNGTISSLGQQATFEGWITWEGGGVWQRIFDFGISDGGEDSSSGAPDSAYIFMTPQSGPGPYRVGYRTPGVERVLDASSPLPTNQEHHVALVWDETTTRAELYLNGKLVDRDTATHLKLADLQDVNNWLGRAQWPDPMFNGSYNEFRIYNHALSEREVLESFIAGPDQVGGGTLGNVESVTVESDRNDVIIGKTRQLDVRVNYTNAQVDYSPESTITGTLTLTSSDENIATVDSNGVVTALSEGSFTITAQFEGKEAVFAMESIPTPLPPAELVHRYDFNGQPGDTVLPDLVGDADGQIFGSLNGSGQLPLFAVSQNYVNLPNGIISALTNMTVETWVTAHDVGGNWQRVFDFGATSAGEDPDPNGPGYSGTSYIFLGAKIGGNTTSGMRFAFREGGTENPVIDTPSYPREQQMHVVVTYNFDGETVRIYFNGVQVASGIAVHPLSTVEDINNWLGRSQWSGDAFFDGTFDEFRIYEGVLSPFQVAVNAAAGPNTIIEDAGAFQALQLERDTVELIEGGLPSQLNLMADFANVQNVNVTGLRETTFTSSNESVLQVSDMGVITPVDSGTATVTAEFDGQQVTLDITVQAAQVELALLHRYSFNEPAGATTVTDLVGDKDGTLVGEGQFVDGQLVLPGGGASSTGGYVDLPNWMISELPAAATFESWVTWNGGPVWQRIFDFGNNVAGEDAHGTGSTYLFLTPSSGPGPVRAAFTLDSGAAESPVLQGSAPLPTGTQSHVIVTYDSDLGVARLYVNGERVDTEPVTQPLSQLWDVNNWLGRSNWPDARFNGSFNEFRIYAGAMTDIEAEASFQRGPELLPGEEPPVEPELTITENSDGTITISWPAALANYQLESRATLDETGTWTPVTATPEVDGTSRTVTITPSESAQFYRLRQQP